MKLFIVIVTILAVSSALARSEDVRVISKHTFMVKLCENVPEMERGNIKDGIQSMLDKYEVQGRQITEATCDHYWTNLENAGDLFHDKALVSVIPKLLLVLYKVCENAPKLKHEDVSKMATNFVNVTLLRSLEHKKDKLLLFTQFVLHLLLTHYDIESSHNDFKEADFLEECKDHKKLLMLLFAM